MDNPDGTGALTISRMMIEADSVSLTSRARLRVTVRYRHHTFSYIGEDRSGPVQGEARTFLEDGGS